MKEIALTRGKAALVDDEDFDRLCKYKWYYHYEPKRAGDEKGYACHTTWNPETKKRGCIRMHRVVMNVEDSKIEVDHENGNGLDNRKGNLRLSTRRQNARNMRIPGKNKYIGVQYFDTGTRRWHSKIKLDGRYRYLGSFETAEGAARARDRAAIESGCPFFKLNFPIDK